MMKGKRIFVALALVMAMVCLPVMAMADMATVGDVFLGNSWGQTFNENGVYTGFSAGIFDKLEVFIIGAGTFETPGMRNFTASGWSGNTVNAQYTVANGPVTSNTNWDFIFNDPKAALTMDYFAYSGTQLLGATHIMFDGGSGWSSNGSVLYSDGVGYDRSPVPIPPTALLLGTGLLGIVGVGWRRRGSKSAAA